MNRANGRKVKKMSKKKCILGIVSALVSTIIAAPVLVSILAKSVEDPYLQSVLLALIEVVALILIIVLFGQKDKLRSTVKSFGKGLIAGGVMAGTAVVMLVINTVRGITEVGIPKMGIMNSLLYVLILLLTGGVSEELMYRGVIMNFVRENMGESKKSMITSMIISSFLFGAVHLINLMGMGTDDVVGTLCQVGYSMSLGFMLAAVYARSHNIWANILIHFIYDLSLMIYSGIFKNETVTVSSLAGEHSIVLISAAIFAAGIAVSMFLLRKKKIGECFENTPDAA